jgi:hypothetical protein
VDVLIASIEVPATYLDIGSGQRRQRTSDLAIEGSSWQRVLDIVKGVGGTRYLTGHGAANYLGHEAFETAGVRVEYMAYSQTPWPRGGRSFSPFVTILDLIAYAGRAGSQYLVPKTVPWRQFLAAKTAKGG